MQSSPDAYMSELRELLSKPHLGSLIPELDRADPAHLRATERGTALLEWCRTAPDTIPLTSYTAYRQFRATGDRQAYERPYFAKRQQLTQETLALWLGAEEASPDRINDLIWSICEETNWVLPAHEQSNPYIDLFCAETGVELAHVLLLVGHQLPEEIGQRVRTEIARRIIDPFLDYGEGFSWRGGRNNWTGVCAGSVGQVLLLLEPDVERQAKGLTLVLDALNNFIERGFEEDGVCLEGIGYWNYGLLHFVAFAEMLRGRTEGAIDLLAQEKLKAIAQYPVQVCLGRRTFASFADSHEASSVTPFLAARLNQPALLGLVSDGYSWRVTTVLRNLLWWDGAHAPEPSLADVFLPVSGLVRLVGEAEGRPVVLMAKAGHNAEPHNHNDVGSLILRIADETYLCDPGAGLYTRDYFSGKRYENIFANSFGHSVPRIGAMLQPAGSQFRGALEQIGEKSVRIVFREAYDIPELEAATRTLTMNPDGTVQIEDQFRFRGPGLETEEAFLTWHAVEVDGDTARIRAHAGVLELHAASGGVFTVERLEEACRANQKDGVLTRIAMSYPPAPEGKYLFKMRFIPSR